VSNLTDHEINRIVAAVARNFRTFGGDRKPDGFTLDLMPGKPAAFAAGVDVADVVRFVLAAAQQNSPIIGVMKFIELSDTVAVIMESRADWKTKYNLVFDTLSDEISRTGIEFDWCDPDATYQEDVTTYADAVLAKAAELKKINFVASAE
jgi:hypothetical protein